jgi:16S rRNA G966 N2-methylase RsmD
MTLDEFHKITVPEALEYLRNHADDNPSKTALKSSASGKKKKNIPDNLNPLPFRAFAEQLACRKKALVKLPRLSKNFLLYDPTSLEQCSGEDAADYKCSLFQGERMIDLTGGLGIDSIYFAQKFSEVVHCEINPVLHNIAKFNFEKLGIKNIEAIEGDGLEILQRYPDNYFDLIFADPARRDSTRRYTGLQNCTPDITSNTELLFCKSNCICVKASPALEIEEVKKQLPYLSEYIVVSSSGECKESLLILKKEWENKSADNRFKISAVSLGRGSIEEYEDKEKTKARNIISGDYEKIKFLYEPDGAIIKARLTSSVAEKYDLDFFNNSISYMGGCQLYSDFPGRCFAVISFHRYKVQILKNYFKENEILSANIARRDFPLSPEKLFKELKLKNGGNDYLFFTKDSFANLICIHCMKPDM